MLEYGGDGCVVGQMLNIQMWRVCRLDSPYVEDGPAAAGMKEAPLRCYFAGSIRSLIHFLAPACTLPLVAETKKEQLVEQK